MDLMFFVTMNFGFVFIYVHFLKAFCYIGSIKSCLLPFLSNTQISLSAILDCVPHQNEAGRACWNLKGCIYKGFEWRYRTNMANDHCSVNCCTNDKRNGSGKDLSFFNFPSNETQRSQWIAAIKRDEGPNFQVSDM